MDKEFIDGLKVAVGVCDCCGEGDLIGSVDSHDGFQCADCDRQNFDLAGELQKAHWLAGGDIDVAYVG